MFLGKLFYKNILLSVFVYFCFLFFNSVIYARASKYSFDDCKSVLKQCFPSYNHDTGKINSNEKICMSKGKACLSVVKGLIVNCDMVLDSCFQSSCSGASCIDLENNINLGMACLTSAGVQYQYKCYSKLKLISMSYASKAKSFADTQEANLKQMEIQAKQQTEQAQIKAQSEQANNQIASQERIQMAELQLQREEAERQAKEREQERIAQEKANRDPNSDIIVSLNGLKKVLNAMERSINEAKDLSGYVKYKLKSDSKLDDDLMWFKPARNILSSLAVGNRKYIYKGNDFLYNELDSIDSDAMSSMFDDNEEKKGQSSDTGVYYTCSKNINTNIVHVPLSSYYNHVQDFLSNFEDIILIAKDSPDAMYEIDFTCVDSVQVYIQPLNEYINELASINKTALCRFDSSSFMNALEGMGGFGNSGLPRGKDGRFARLDSGSNKNKGFDLLNSLGSVPDDTSIGGIYNTDLISTDNKTDALAGAKIARAVGYASDINRALMYCYTNTLQSMKKVITSKRNSDSVQQNTFGGLTGLITRIGSLTRVEKVNGNNKSYFTNSSEVSALCNDISDYAVQYNLFDKYNQYNACKSVCSGNIDNIQYNIVVSGLQSCIQLLTSSVPASGNIVPQKQ